MTIFIIERLVKRKWHPLSFIKTQDYNKITLSNHTYPCHCTKKKEAETILDIASTTFKDERFRISEYSRK